VGDFREKTGLTRGGAEAGDVGLQKREAGRAVKRGDKDSRGWARKEPRRQLKVNGPEAGLELKEEFTARSMKGKKGNLRSNAQGKNDTERREGREAFWGGASR